MTLIEIAAGVLLLLGNVLVIRAVAQADGAFDPEAVSRGEARAAAPADIRRAA